MLPELSDGLKLSSSRGNWKGSDTGTRPPSIPNGPSEPAGLDTASGEVIRESGGELPRTPAPEVTCVTAAGCRTVDDVITAGEARLVTGLDPASPALCCVAGEGQELL